jgi:hypothetical protein
MAVTARLLLMACTLGAGVSFLWPLPGVEDALPADQSPLSVGWVDQDGSDNPSQDLPLHAWVSRPDNFSIADVVTEISESSESVFQRVQIPSASPRSPTRAS